MTEHELIKPFTEAEQRRWTAYDKRMFEHNWLKRVEENLLQQIEDENREPTPLEQATLSEWRQIRYPLILDIWEVTDFHKLETRHQWRKELTAYRSKAEICAFAQFIGSAETVLKNWLGEFNLPTMVEIYENAKANCNTPQARLSLARRKIDYANKSLVQLDQDDSELSHRLNPNKELGETRRAILGEILGELFEKFIQHVESDLKPEASYTAVENVELQELFELGFTVQHCNDLLKKVQVGPGFDKPSPTHFKAKFWALLDVLSKEDHKLLNCTPIIASKIVGNHYGCAMPNKPSKVRDSKHYKESYNKLENAVKEAIAAKKYGPPRF